MIAVNYLRRLLIAVLVAIATTVLLRAQSGSLSSTFTNWIDHSAIAYRSAPVSDPMSQLNQAMQRGQIADVCGIHAPELARVF